MKRIQKWQAALCYLPLNATNLVHLFKSDWNTLPTTLYYGIFSSIALNCIQRHLKLRAQCKDVTVSIESLDQLPDVAKKPFLVLCQLAYDGITEGKIIFTSLPPDVNTLSLLSFFVTTRSGKLYWTRQSSLPQLHPLALVIRAASTLSVAYTSVSTLTMQLLLYSTSTWMVMIY